MLPLYHNKRCCIFELITFPFRVLSPGGIIQSMRNFNKWNFSSRRRTNFHPFPARTFPLSPIFFELVRRHKSLGRRKKGSGRALLAFALAAWESPMPRE